MTPEQHQAVYRAVARGVPPTDPTLHRPALDLARYQLEKALRGRTGMVALLGGLTAVCALLAVTNQSWWFAVCALVLAETLIQELIYSVRQRRRVTRLERAAPRGVEPAASV